MSLTEWVIIFIKHKDILKNNLQNIEQKQGVVHAIFKDGKRQDFFIFEDIIDILPLLETAKKTDADINYSIHALCYNTKQNLKLLIENWQLCTQYQRLSFYFVNPKSSTDTKWVVNPWLHNKISEHKKLEAGLNSMFLMVEEWKG